MIETETFWPTTRPPEPIISDEELEYLFAIDKEEMVWKNNLPNYSFKDTVNMFAPECIAPARRGLKAQLKNFKEQIRRINRWQEQYYEERILNLPWQERNDFQAESDKDFDEMRKKINSKVKSLMFNLSYLDELEGKSKPRKTSGVLEADIQRAKEISITNFYPNKLQIHGQRASGTCPFHSEKQPSFVIYLDQNTWWCYSCQTGGSVIDFIMRQQNVDFLTAVKLLIK